MEENTRKCSVCKEEKPLRLFRFRKRLVTTCSVCRRRAYMRRWTAAKRGVDALRLRLARQIAADKGKHREKEKNALKRVLRSRFLKLTSATRSRIKKMEAQENPSMKTQHALAVRRELLARYEAAYATQLRAVEWDAVPADIVDIVWEQQQK